MYRFKIGDVFYHKDKKLSLRVDSFFVGSEGQKGYVLEVLYDAVYTTKENKHTRWVRYFEDRLVNECLIDPSIADKFQDEMKNIEDLKRELKDWKRAAKEWMNAHDKLKERYEPMVIVPSNKI